jgi:translocation and assembly module TamB
MQPTDTSTPPAAEPAAARPPRRALRTLAWAFAGLIALALALGAAAWWWLGSDQSLAFALAKAARYMPAGQTLHSREVTGSLRAGGRIGFLQWQSPTLSVEVRDARIGWQLAPLLRRKVQFGEVHAAQVLIERRGPAEDKPDKPDEPLQPLERLVLPVEVDLPFHIDAVHWAGPPAVEAANLSGSYRYAQAQHALVLDGVDLADGRYTARVALQGPAPMAIDAALDGRVRAPLAEGRSIDVLAHATVQGSLAGSAARLAVAAELKPAEQDDKAPMQARLQAHIAPWQSQPVIDADADLRNVDLARLWPAAPATLLSGRVQAGPGSAGSGIAWQAAANIRNALPGPWDRGRLPIEQIEARTTFDGSTWTVPSATLRAGGGRIEAEGGWSPAPAPWDVRATVHGLQLGALHTQLAGAPVSGRASVEQRDEALRFDVALQAQGGDGSPVLQGLRLDRALAQGQWKDQVLDLRALRIEAAQASVDGKLQARVAERAGSGDLKLVLPGGSAQVNGRIAPAQGNGEIRLRIDSAATVQHWVERLPGLAGVFAGAAADGSARLDAHWRGGWEAVQRRLQNAATPVPRGVAEPSVQATLTVPRLDLRLPQPAGAATRSPVQALPPAPPARPLQLRAVRAELAGSLAQATLALQGETLRGTQKLTLDTRASGALESAGRWRAAVASFRMQAQDSTRPGPWTLALNTPLNASVRGMAGGLDVDASAGGATLQGPVPGTVRLDWEPVRFSQAGTAAQRAFRLQTKGRMQGLPMAWAEAMDGSSTLASLGVSGDLLFDGEWDIEAGDALRASARLARSSGDIRVQAGEAALVTRIDSRGTGTKSEIKMTSATGGIDSLSTPAGLRQAELRLDAQGETVRAQLTWDSERAGDIRAQASTRMLQRAGGWQWPADAPLAGSVKARMPSLGVWSMLAPPGWRVAGTLDADATLSGSRAAPRWNGALAADQLALRALVEGLDLRDGRLRARLAGDRVEITDFTLKGGRGSSARIAGQSGNISTTASEAARDGGTLSARGELRWGVPPAAAGGSGIRMAMQAELRSLRVLVRSDRQLTLSGDLQTRLDDGQFTVRGKLETERAVVILPDESAPGLGADVVVHSAARDREAAEAAQRQAASTTVQTARPPDVAVSFDLGKDFAVQGRGITTRLEGQLEIRVAALNAPPRITGEVRTVKGQYRAYGQQLDVESGLARFNGPFDNPALDILALRPNISQRAGVQVSGTAQAPRVKLYSEPALSDVETLSWVVLGRASASSSGESILMQQAALALLGGLGKGGSGGSLASRLGLDEIGFKGPASGAELRESAVTLGKRLSKDFYVTYESSFNGMLGTLYIFYDLTQRLTLRGQAGQLSAMDLIYTVKYD